MPGHRIQRTNEDIKRELTSILRELKDPRVRENFLSIVRVDTTNDLSYTKVYVSSMNGLDKAKEAVKVLNKASGYVRKQLGDRLSIRHTPKVIFEPTDSIEYGATISKMLNDLKDNKDE